MQFNHRRWGFLIVVVLACASCTASDVSPSPATVVSLPDECDQQTTDPPACKLTTQSPDGSLAAYVHLEKNTGYCTRFDDSDVPTVKIFRQGDSLPAEIYRPALWNIGKLEWTGDGRLLIWDTHYDLYEFWGVTAVYDPQAGGIVRRLSLTLAEGFTSWNTQKTAFYANQFGTGQTPCSTLMGGYDFDHDRELPSFHLSLPQSEYVQVVGSPAWSKDGTELYVSVSSGTFFAAEFCTNIEWGPSAIMMLDLDADELSPVVVKGDYENSYTLLVRSNGEYEILGEPYAPFSSQCCRGG